MLSSISKTSEVSTTGGETVTTGCGAQDPPWLYIYIRVAQKNWKFCDSGQMMGEVIMNWFYFTIFDFVNYSTEQCSKSKLQILRCAHAQKQMGRICYKNAAETYVAMDRIKYKECRWKL